MENKTVQANRAHLPETIENPHTLFCGHIHSFLGDNCESAPHAHSKTQILYASSGIIRLKTQDGVFVIPPSRAIWIPPNFNHSLYFSGVFESTNLYLANSLVESFPQSQCRLIAVDNLLRELFLKATQISAIGSIQQTELNLINVMLDLLIFEETPGLYLGRPRDERLAKLVCRLEDDISDNTSLDQLAKEAGASPRTISRLFKSEMNMSFKQWRGQLRVFRGIELLASGASVTQVALDVGFESTSSFVSHFKTITGKTPAKYFR